MPEIAARAHVEIIDRLVARALATAGVTLKSLDGIAAAAGPGLIGGVIVGLTTAKALALAARQALPGGQSPRSARADGAHDSKPYISPICCSSSSGGHTQLVAVRGVGDYVRLGTTLDDAIGEAFDKVAKMLGLPYPGGPRVEGEALAGDPARFALPRPMLGRAVADFSLSGLKTAVRLEAERIAPLSAGDVRDLCASFQAAVIDVVVDRMRAGLRAFRHRVGQPEALVVAGGVAANAALARAIGRFAGEVGLPLVIPPARLCTDNGAMIAWAGIERLRLGLVDDMTFPARPRWPLDLDAERVHNGKA